MKAKEALPVILSLIAVLVSGLSLFYSAFHVEPKLMVLVPSVSLDGEQDRCEEKNQSGACLKFKLSLQTILINDGNRPTTLIGIKMLVPDPSMGGTKPYCWNGNGQTQESLRKPLVVEQGKTKVYSTEFTSYAFLKDPSMFRMIDNDSWLYLCISFDALDHTGHRVEPQIMYVGEFYLEGGEDETLVHWSETAEKSIVLVP